MNDLSKDIIISSAVAYDLADGMYDKDVVFVDASFYLPGAKESAVENYKNEHIKGAVFFNVSEIKDSKSPLPHMLPSEEVFSREVSNIGIKNEDILVIYGQTGMVMGPCRAWWMFKGFGHKHVYILDGGLPEWKRQGFETTQTQVSKLKSDYRAKIFKTDMLANMNDVIVAAQDSNTKIIDARPFERFSGQNNEPRENMRSGHIPNSINLPCSTLVTEAGCLLPKKKMEEKIRNLLPDINDTENIIVTCGSGITACFLYVVLKTLNIPGKISVYDGSWSEWGRTDSDTEVCKK